MSVAKQYKQAQVEESETLAIELLLFGLRWDARVAKREKADHYRKDEMRQLSHRVYVRDLLVREGDKSNDG